MGTRTRISMMIYGNFSHSFVLYVCLAGWSSTKQTSTDTDGRGRKSRNFISYVYIALFFFSRRSAKKMLHERMNYRNLTFQGRWKRYFWKAKKKEAFLIYIYLDTLQARKEHSVFVNNRKVKCVSSRSDAITSISWKRCSGQYII